MMPDIDMIRAFEAWRDGTRLTDIKASKRDMGAFARRFWPSDLPTCGFQMFVIDDERGGRATVIDEIVANARDGREWSFQSAKRTITI